MSMLAVGLLYVVLYKPGTLLHFIDPSLLLHIVWSDRRQTERHSKDE